MAIDTGTGGINIDGQTYTMDVGVADSDGGNQGPWSPGEVNVDNTQKDLTKPTKETFAKYLSKTTLGLEGPSTHANVYPVGRGDATTVVEVSLKDTNGLPVSPGAVGDQAMFSDAVNNTMGAPAPLQMKKGLATGNTQDGNFLLKKAAQPGPAGEPYVKNSNGLNEPIKAYTQTIVDQNLYDYDQKSTPAVEPSEINYFAAVPHTTALLDAETAVRETGQDFGTFTPTVKNPQSRALGQITVINRAISETHGKAYATGGKNTYTPVEEGAGPGAFIVVSLLDEKGLPRSPTADQASDTSTTQFIPGKELPSTYSDAAAKIDSSLKRGKNAKGTIDGNTLLKDAPSGPVVLSGPVHDYVSAVLSKNRFTGNKHFLPDAFEGPLFPDIPGAATDLVSDAGNERFMLNNAYASPQQMAFGKSLGPEVKREYTFRRLTRIGTILQLRATGEIQALADDATDPRDNVTVLASLLPGVGQFGAGIPLSTALLDVRDIITTLPDEGTNFPPDIPIYEGQLVDFSTFEGVLTNVFDKFSGFTAIGMLATCAVLVIAVVAGFTGLGALLGMNDGSNIAGGKSPKKFYGRGRHALGSFYGSNFTPSNDDIISIFLPVGGDSSKLLRFLGIMPTVSIFADAVNAGVKLFFGLDEDYAPKTTIQSPGHYTVQARSIIRSLIIIALAFKDLIDLMASGNVVSGFEQLLEILGIIKNSRFVASLNIFAQIGDRAAQEERFPLDDSGVSTDVTLNEFDAGKKISTIDGAPIRANSAVIKSRLDANGFYSTRLAWAASMSPATFVLPSRTAAFATADPTMKSGPLEVTPHIYSRIKFERLQNSSDLLGSRLPTLQREAIESQHDSEYVPFYFHDLRTNEILGFHAFLQSLTDDYTANYESTDAFGRIDPIKTYKNTTRKISFSFIIASLDSQDFDVMWAKINKLLTMVYPQYTSGRTIEVSDGAYKFVRPFTQLIAAAPMIRLRIGNVISSNYSKFGLARLFGFYNPGTTLDNVIIEDSGEAVKNVELFSKDPANKYKPGYMFYVNQKVYTTTPSALGSAVGNLLSLSNETSAELFTLKLDLADANYYLDKQLMAEVVEYKPASVTSTVPKVIIKFVESEITNDNALYLEMLGTQKVSYAAYAANKGLSTDMTYVAALEDFIGPSEQTELMLAADQLEEAESSNTGEFLEKVRALMDDTPGSPGANKIAQSFRSAGGRGLAGFIDSMNFDWLSQTTWDTDPGRKAPKMCKVNVSFTPIHDISPGLDHDGYNRAPVYQLGPHYAQPSPQPAPKKN